MNNIKFEVIEYGKDKHKKALKLRKQVLYDAIGIMPSNYIDEESHIQIAGFINEELVATCSLVPENNDCRMRFVAIKDTLQGSGVGSLMLSFFEEQARLKNFKSIYCHARDTAIKFYSKNGYKAEGEMFEQVTIPHVKMRKVLI